MTVANKGSRKRSLSAAKKTGAVVGRAVGSMERTRRLLLAALRVWELKRRYLE